MAAEPALIAIVGAESTGKTTLAQALGHSLAQGTGRRVAVVPETLREWCDRHGRTPLAHEQAAIVQAHHERIDAAGARHDIVVCDTTALMTAVYSRLLFGDRSLESVAAALHARVAATLLTALDLPWVADGHQRDGAHVREPVDALLREMLAGHGLPYAVIGGTGDARLAQALAAIQPVLHGPAPGAAGGGRGGWLTRLAADAAPAADRPESPEAPTSSPPHWRCECCVPDAERASFPAPR